MALFHTGMFAEGDYIVMDDLKKQESTHFMASIYRRLCSKYALSIVGELYSERANYQDLKPILVKRILGLPSGSFGQCWTSILKPLPDFTYDYVHMLMRILAHHDSRPSAATHLLELKNLLPYAKDWTMM